MRLIFLCCFLSLGIAKPLPNFRVVKNHAIYRGGAPTSEGLQVLKDSGISTILSIRDENPFGTFLEKRHAEEIGLLFISIPISALLGPSDEDMREIEEILADPFYYPIYIHCTHGQDRTGLSIALFRVCVQGWTPEAAYWEMMHLGFHGWLSNLRWFFWKNAKKCAQSN